MDIIESLRKASFRASNPLALREAADEIERLRTALGRALYVLRGIKPRSRGEKAARENAVEEIEKILNEQ